MKHFGLITPPVPGHIHPFAALGRELIARGHRVTCFHMQDLEAKIRSEGLEFWPIGLSDHPRGSLPRSLAELATRRGVSALRFTIDAVARTTKMTCRDAPAAIREAAVDALLVDQMEPAGGAVAEHLQLPFVTVCNAMAINRDPAVPPPFTPWAYRNVWWARLLNRAGYAISDRLTKPISDAVGQYRKNWNLPILRSPDDSFSRLAQICQMPRELDFPRSALPESFHYVGPLRGAVNASPSFPWERLDGRRVVYASLGTLQNRREPLFRCFAEACRGLNVQLVIAHGGGLGASEAKGLPGDPLVVEYAPQLELLARARLTITHGGLNTVLDSLANGVPLVVIPLTYEQPAIARRVEWVGAGQSLSSQKLNPSRLRRAVHTTLEQPQYEACARRIQESIVLSRGVGGAADTIESVCDV